MMKTSTIWMCLLCALGLGLAACGDDDDDSNLDSGTDGGADTDTDADSDADGGSDTDTDADTDADCGSTTEVTFDPATATMYTSDGSSYTLWNTAITPDIGIAGDTDIGRIEFYADETGTFDLATGVNNNYATCSQCVRAFQDATDTDATVSFFQKSGSMTVDVAPVTNSATLDMSMTDVTLIEVTMDSSYNTTPVSGGACLHIASFDANVGCGNGTIDGSEDCDGTELGEATCATQNYTSGTLACSATCAFDTSACTGWICNATDLGTFSGADITRTDVDNCTAGYYYDAVGNTACTSYSSSGPEVVYSLTLAAGAAVTVTMTGDASFDASLWATTSCDDVDASSCFAGSDSTTTGGEETITITNSGAANATYYIIADGYSTTCGTFDLTVTAAGEEPDAGK